LTLRSSAKKHSPHYTLHIIYTAPSGKTWQDSTVTGSFTTWFNKYGYLDKKEFQEWLCSQIDVLRTMKEEVEKKEGRVPVLLPAVQADVGYIPPNMEFSQTTGVENASAVPTSAKKGRPKKKV
jgi:hypothetical protein